MLISSYFDGAHLAGLPYEAGKAYRGLGAAEPRRGRPLRELGAKFERLGLSLRGEIGVKRKYYKQDVQYRLCSFWLDRDDEVSERLPKERQIGVAFN